MDEITTTIARAALVTAIAQKGADYVYPDYAGGCQYSVDGQPACLVGVAVASLGGEYFNVLAAEEQEQLAVEDGLPLISARSLPIERLAKEALQAAQNVQDGGGEWGRALEEFDRVVADGGY